MSLRSQHYTPLLWQKSLGPAMPLCLYTISCFSSHSSTQSFDITERRRSRICASSRCENEMTSLEAQGEIQSKTAAWNGTVANFKLPCQQNVLNL